MERNNLISIVIFLAGILTLLYALYYIQQLSLNIGIGAGAGIIAGSNANIIVNVTIAQLANSIPALQFALSISYMLFVLSLIMVLVGGLQLFSKRAGMEWSVVMAIVSLAYIAISILLETSFVFAEPYTIFSLSTIAGFLILLLSAYNIIIIMRQRGRSFKNIRIDPSKPYSNMLKLSDELISKMNGNIKILDMHFDSIGLKNLAILLDLSKRNYTAIYVLTGHERMSSRFARECMEFRHEMQNKNIYFELRIMDVQDTSMQHERLMFDNTNAYKIPPFNIINKKSEHIVKMSHIDANRSFDKLWAQARKIENQ